MEFKFLKIVVFVPESHANQIREVLAGSGCGHTGKYDNCTFSVSGVGRFRGLEGSNPFIGEIGKIKDVPEERIETICPSDKLDAVIEAIRVSHPYEEPALDVYPLLNN